MHGKYREQITFEVSPLYSEISRSRQGLHVQAVRRIEHRLCTDIKPPPFGSSKRSFITGVTRVDTTGANAIRTKFSSPELTDCLAVAARALVFGER